MNKTEDALKDTGQDRVILWKDIDANDPEVATLLRQDFRELVDMLTDEMVGKAVGYILGEPEYVEDYNEGEIAEFERGKALFKGNVGAGLNGGCEKSVSLMRAELSRLADSMSASFLATCIDILGSTALLNIPEDLTEEEIADIIAGDEEIKRGEYVKWEDVKRTDV